MPWQTSRVLDFDQMYDRLLATLADLSALLRSHGETGWGEWIERSSELIAAGDAYGLEKLLGAFGGMGSFNDLVLHEHNGHPLTSSGADDANHTLSELRTSALVDVQALRRSLDR